MTLRDRPEPTEIEITPEMIAAGVDALCLFEMSQDDLEVIATTVFRAMSKPQYVHLDPC